MQRVNFSCVQGRAELLVRPAGTFRALQRVRDMVDLEHFAAYLDVLGLLTRLIVAVIGRHLLVFVEGTPLGVCAMLPSNSGRI